MTVMDPRFRDLDPAPIATAASIDAARGSLHAATASLLRIPDDRLEREWAWIGDGESDVRTGFYIAIQTLQRAAGEIAVMSGRVGADGQPALGSLASATAARWDLHGVLAPLPDEALDADPGGGEWSIRQTLSHTLAVQRAYPYFSAWWLTQRDEPEYPRFAPDTLDEDLPSEDANASGSLADIRRRMDALTDLSIDLWREATDDDLAVRARWSGFPIDVSFRVGRWGPHIEEHTLQIEKTLAMIGRAPTEVDRLVRLIHRSMGRLEASALLVAPEALESQAGATITAAASDVERIAREIGVAASAPGDRSG